MQAQVFSSWQITTTKKPLPDFSWKGLAVCTPVCGLSDEEVSTVVAAVATVVVAWAFLTWLVVITRTVVVPALGAWPAISTIAITTWSAVTVKAASTTVSTAIATASTTVTTTISAASAAISAASAAISTKAIATWTWSAWHILFCFHSLWHWKKSLT
jgi:hypothetical protein